MDIDRLIYKSNGLQDLVLESGQFFQTTQLTGEGPERQSVFFPEVTIWGIM